MTSTYKWLRGLESHEFYVLKPEGRLYSGLEPDHFYALVGSERRWYTPAQAALYLGVKQRTLASWHASGMGPMYRGKGENIRYHRDVVDAFAFFSLG